MSPSLADPAVSPLASVPWMRGTAAVRYGADYYPEQWPREVWDEDVALMREAGVNLVSLGVFSWALLEPREGEFDFAWLDDAIETLHAAGIGVNLGTPTASPPAWFWKAYPQARPVTRSGVPLGFGSRGLPSPSSPEYARAVERLVGALAQRYGRHPAVQMWHVHNEYGAPVSESYDDASVAAFRLWLQRRYGGLDRLNRAWGTVFWGQRYGAWDEVDAPRQAATTVNPAQRLDFARFSDDALLQCFIRERDLIRRFSDAPVTTNFMATSCLAIDYWKWAREVDVVANDHYLTASRADAHVLLSLDADMSRSLAGGKPWVLMEHSTSAVNWQDRNLAKQPGQLARNSLAHWARGADGIMFFQWRASRFGAEKFHSAMVPHGGSDTRVFRESAALGADLGRLGEALGSTVRARVGILWDWESFWAQDLEWRPSVDLSHRRQIENYYGWLWNAGVTVDFVHPGEGRLDDYALLLAPSLYLVTAASSARLRDYVDGGGVLVAGYFSGIVDENDTVPVGAEPHGLREVLGLRVDEFRPLLSGQTVRLTDGSTGAVWTDAVALEGAEAVLGYEDGPSAGGPAVTRNARGAGSAWYVSTELAPEALARVLAPALAEAGVVAESAGRGVESVTRVGEEAEYAAYLNHGEVAVEIPGGGVDLLSGEQAAGVFALAPGAVRVIRRERAESTENRARTN